MIGCDCNAGLSNTGRPNCVPIQSVVSSLIVVPLYANDGTQNGITLNSLPTWNDLVNEADASKRWFPLPAFENVELPKADSQFEEANSGRMAYLRQGKRSFSGELWAEDSTPTFLGKLAASRCVDFGIFIVDVNGALIGSKSSDDLYLYPIPVDNASWDPKFMFATDSTVQKIMLGFDFDRLFQEQTMYMINADEAIDFTTLKGLVDVTIFGQTAASTSAIDLKTKFDYGTAVNPLVFSGATSTSDWDLYNVSAGAAVPVLTVTESVSVPGQYALTFAAQTAADVIKISVARDGFIGDAEVTLP
ncbi:MAG: hypothetical protein Unbinned2903contig1001_22 [Prokaryotic dsDNA virus sp.]|nr:MAG: hypothetical protein Unbinned2903contig1001_22 [Prokaryotic dsDNA virus sp.]|tara:strand:+ start:11565 stop:12476 length:912 start_codon:yes stop_codon:yes gene_type:complete